jgi:hypothetical protein
MDQYLTHTRYLELGGKLPILEFTRSEMMARVKIDTLTRGQLAKLADDDPVWAKVEFLVFEIIARELLGKLDGKDAQSESAGKMSATWVSKDGKADELIKQFLPSFVGGGVVSVGILRT